MIEKKLQKYILSNVFAMMGTSLYILADTFFISLAGGANGITALNLVLPLYGLIFAIGAMLGVGSATRYSINKAAKSDDYNDYFSNSIIWSLLVSLVFIVVLVLFPDKILKLMGADDAILGVGLPYIKIVLWFTPFFMINYTFTSFVRNDGSPDIAMHATVLSGIFNILFDYIFMFPMEMGMVGAALATGVSPIVSMLICMRHYLSKKNTIKFTFKIPSAKKLFESCKLGVVAFVGEISSGITTMVFNLVLLSLVGNVAVAAYGIVANIALVGISLLNGVAYGLQPLASYSHGAGDEISKKKIYRHSLKIGLVISVVLVGLMLIFSSEFVSIFNSENSKELENYATLGLRLYFLGFLFAGINIIKAGFLSAVGMARESSVISLLRGVVSIVIFVFLLSKMFGIVGVWLAFPVAELFTFAMSEIFINKSFK